MDESSLRRKHEGAVQQCIRIDSQPYPKRYEVNGPAHVTVWEVVGRLAIVPVRASQRSDVKRRFRPTRTGLWSSELLKRRLMKT